MDWPNHRVINSEREDAGLCTAWPARECLPDTASERLRSESLPHGVRGRRLRAIAVRQAFLHLVDSRAGSPRLCKEFRRDAVIVNLEGAAFGALQQRLLLGQLLLQQVCLHCPLRSAALGDLGKVSDIALIKPQLLTEGVD
jgi:hypothetical protein